MLKHPRDAFTVAPDRLRLAGGFRGVACLLPPILTSVPRLQGPCRKTWNFVRKFI